MYVHVYDTYVYTYARTYMYLCYGCMVDIWTKNILIQYMHRAGGTEGDKEKTTSTFIEIYSDMYTHVYARNIYTYM